MWRTLCFLISAFALTVAVQSEEQNGLVNCLFANDTMTCIKKSADVTLDAMELEVTGRKVAVPFSKVIEDTGSLIIDGVRAAFRTEDEEPENDLENDGTGVRTSRKKHLLKKKKKLFMKLYPILHLMKAKISLMLQAISTHLQIKFFLIAIASLLINLGRFWYEIKKGHQPTKVIYYEQAHHQHHYDADEESWKRSVDNGDHDPQEMAYSAYAPNE